MAKIHKITKQSCIVCTDDTEELHPIHKTRRQTHSLCLTCLSAIADQRLSHVIRKYKNGLSPSTDEYLFQCPGTYCGVARNQCKHTILYSCFIRRSVFDLLSSTIQKKMRIVDVLYKHRSAVMCPTTDCLQMYYNPFNPHPKNKKVTCYDCKVSWCSQCHTTPFHDDKTCAQHRIESDNTEFGQHVRDEIANGNMKLCPTCHVPTEKTRIKGGTQFEGCNKMHCAHCDTNWCWLCGTKGIDYDHFSSATSPCRNLLWQNTAIDQQPELVVWDDDTDDED